MADKLYELRRDIWTPVMYIKAGAQKTEAEWKDKLGEFNIQWESMWFIDLENEKDTRPIDELKELIDDVFKNRGLSSLSYKDAAREVAELWLKQNKQPNEKEDSANQY